MERKVKRKQMECKHRYQEYNRKGDKITEYKCVKCGFLTKDMEDDPNVTWSLFRCQNLVCNKLLERETDRHDGFCRGCQGIKFVIATYLTEEEKVGIDTGNTKPYRVNLDVIGIEPPTPREVR